MTIGELAVRSGLTASAIRYYEKLGLLKAPGRSNGRRVYDSEILHQLIVIQFAKDTGFTLPEIRLLLRGFPNTTTASVRWKQLAYSKSKELDHILAKVQAMKKMLEAVLSCQCRNLAECARRFANCSPKPPFVQGRTQGGISKAI
jgi:MerR family redox-sensitive transcriptional activator SoxR